MIGQLCSSGSRHSYLMRLKWLLKVKYRSDYYRDVVANQLEVPEVGFCSCMEVSGTGDLQIIRTTIINLNILCLKVRILRHFTIFDI